jgi:hypothetical protein
LSSDQVRAVAGGSRLRQSPERQTPSGFDTVARSLPAPPFAGAVTA